MNFSRNILQKMVRGYRNIVTQAYREQAMQILTAPKTQVQVEVQPTVQQPAKETSPPTTQPATQIQPVQAVQTLPIVLPFTSQLTEIFPQMKKEKEKAEEKEEIKKKEEEKKKINEELEVKIAPLVMEEEAPQGLTIPLFSLKKIRHLQPKAGLIPIKEISYPLIPRKPEKGETILAYVKIYWDRRLNKYIYQLVEPTLTPEIKNILHKVKELLEEKLDVDFSKLKVTEAAEYLSKQINELMNYYDFKLTEDEKKILRYYIERDFIGLGKIEPLMRDPNIEDISCDGVGIPIFVFHRNQDLGSVISNIVFDDADELDSFVTKLAQITGKSVSVAEPLVDGTLPDGSRLQATLATDIARRGSNFTIRKFTEEPLTPIHLLNYQTIDVPSLAYLWIAVDYGRSVLVSGGTASGKTSFLNVLSLFIRPDKKIISIEDTAELRLPHPHWIPTVARSAISVEGRIGEVDMFRLLKESLRQRPDYIIVGEVRGQEAYILFQQMATGHPSLATIHAENIEKLLDRLTTPPISLPKSLIGSLDLIVFMAKMRYRDKFVRRVSEILEMIRFDPDSGRPVVNRIFKWNPFNDKIEITSNSYLLKKISEITGITNQEIIDELERRMFLLNWLFERNITNYKDIYKILNMYYYSPNRVISAILGEF